MSIKRVLVTGATGFIGSRLCEVMLLTGSFQARAFVHSTASAARIARFPIDFVIGDLCDRTCIDKAMRGCDAVVHLARGNKAVMRKGHENVLQAAVDHSISRFVHISSVAVYGNKPPPESTSEIAPAKRTDMAYGNEKLEQERRVRRYSRRYGLPVVILRPPNVYGAFSPFTLGLIQNIRSGTVAIVDGGINPCNVVYIDNLIQGVLLALSKAEAVGEVFFVTDRDVISWEQWLSDHAAWLGVSLERVSAGDLDTRSKQHVIRNSLRLLPRVLLSSQLRRVLRQIPLIKIMETVLYERFQFLSLETQQMIRFHLNGPSIVRQKGPSRTVFDANEHMVASQARTVAHSSEKARRLLGYTAPISYREGMALTEAWLRYSRII